MFELAKFCRICLTKTDELVAFESRDDDNVRLNEKLIFINPHLIPLDDHLPKWVCVTCKKQINDAYCLMEKALDSFNVLDKLMNHIKATGQTNLAISAHNDADIKDLLKTIPDVKEEIEFKVFSEVKQETESEEEKADTATKDTINVLKIRSISSINAIIHPGQSRDECILGDTTQDHNLWRAPSPEAPGPPSINPAGEKPQNKKRKGPITVLFNPKNGRIVPINKSAGTVVGPPQGPQHPIAKYFAKKAEKYTCNICSKTFYSQVGYTVHKNWHEKLERSVPGIVYTCDYCTRAPFKTRGALKRHIESHSVHFKRLKKQKQKVEELRAGKMEIPGVDLGCLSAGPECGQCKQTFTNFGDLNRHRRLEKHEVHKLYETRNDALNENLVQ